MVIGHAVFQDRTRDGVKNVKLAIQGFSSVNARFAFALQAKEIAFWNFMMDYEYYKKISNHY